MAKIPKAEALKWWLIAMLCTTYHVWARRACEGVSAWMASLNRPWIANGTKRASDHAAYDIALDAESVSNKPNNVDITVIDDLEKGFEKVVHQRLRDRADAYRFLVEKLNLALSMYTGERRVRCGRGTVNSIIQSRCSCRVSHRNGPSVIVRIRFCQ